MHWLHHRCYIVEHKVCSVTSEPTQSSSRFYIYIYKFCLKKWEKTCSSLSYIIYYQIFKVNKYIKYFWVCRTPAYLRNFAEFLNSAKTGLNYLTFYENCIVLDLLRYFVKCRPFNNIASLSTLWKYVFL